MPDSDPNDFLPLTPLTFQVLVSLMRAPAHGYGLKRDIEERTAGRMRLGAGTLYTGLQRMERDALIVETEATGDLQEQATSRWRFFTVTDLGRLALRAEVERLEAALGDARGVLAAGESVRLG